MQFGLLQCKGGLAAPCQAAGTQPKPQHGPRSRTNADGVGKASSRLVPRAAQVDEVSADANLSNGAANGSSNPLAFDELTDLLKMVHDTDIVELELRSKRFSLAVRKKEAIEALEPQVVYQQAPPQQGGQQFSPQQYAPPPPPMQQAPPASAPPTPSSSSNGSPPAPAAQDGVEVASPMAGTLYRSPAPGEPAFVKEGDKVTKGQTICIIEAMKLMNEIEADATGTIVKFLTPNGAPVTVGQALALIKP
ncbi:g4980 [Coccomyxa viridis]|uniref:Biotin carboxyl carrier protein of acetyl-CoA carboxylase n=1 Tax=Coccomyxa viridis TaxID=1274662 RepID=A0ABP1FRN0_9CHLO